MQAWPMSGLPFDAAITDVKATNRMADEKGKHENIQKEHY
jgi:hypothetical protein